mmetsp:Transcript_5054/g.10347  ORF Transcript_5054/g.10347 Transcript_5054/m.10347 type:complete len:89 (+) Transcript_5054:130-396(+)
MANVVARTLLARFANGAPPVEPVGAPLDYHDPVIPGVSIPYNDQMPGMARFKAENFPDVATMANQTASRSAQRVGEYMYADVKPFHAG